MDKVLPELWTIINNQTDINNFMEAFSHFHDSCIKKLEFITGMYVSDDKSMGFDKNNYIKIIFQSQFGITVELLFEEVKQLNIHHYNTDKYFNMFFDSSFFIKDDLIYWSDSADEDTFSNTADLTYIYSKKVKYRFIDDIYK